MRRFFENVRAHWDYEFEASEITKSVAISARALIAASELIERRSRQRRSPR